MSIPAKPTQADMPESAVSELHALYREGAADEPDSMLDRRILDAARNELLAAQALTTRPSTPWWKAWARPISTAAVMILGLSLTWSLMDEQERALRDEISSAEISRELAGQTKSGDSRIAPAATAPAPSQDQAPTPEKRLAIEPQAATVAEPRPFPARQDTAAADGGAIGSLAQPPVVADAPAEIRRRQAMPEPPPPAAPPPAMAAPAPAAALAMPKANWSTQDLSQSARTDELKEKKLDTREAAKSYARPEAALRNAEASPKEADATDDAATPPEWLDHIRRLRAAGRNAEAVESLERFRKRYPNAALPDDLLGAKPP